VSLRRRIAVRVECGQVEALGVEVAGDLASEVRVARKHEELSLLRHVFQNLERGVAARLIPVHEHLIEKNGQALAVGVEAELEGSNLSPARRTREGTAADSTFDSRHACTTRLYRPNGPGYYTRSAELAYPDSVKEKAGEPPSSECAFA